MGVSAAVIQEFLRGMDYPARRNGILEKARQNNAPNDVLDILNQLPDQEYGSAAEVSRAIGKIE
jgi:hypothetical protein